MTQPLWSCFINCVYIHIATANRVPERDERSVILGSCSTCNQIRLSRGCSGTLEVLTERFGYGTATDANFGVEEAKVACRQLGCTAGADTRRTFTSK